MTSYPEQSVVEHFPFLGIFNPLAVQKDVNLENYNIVITGSNTGIGRAAAAQLVCKGATVVLACRDPTRGNDAVKYIEQHRDNIASQGSLRYPHARKGKVMFAPLDLGDLFTIKPFVQEHLLTRLGLQRVDVLINNAGLNTSGVTKHGLQQLFQVNYLGHYLLFQEMLPLLQAVPKLSRSDTGGAVPSHGRVVNLSSVMHHVGGDNLRASATTNDGSCKYYDDSKYFMNLFTLEINRRCSQCPYTCAGSDSTAATDTPATIHSTGSRPVLAVSCNPGAVRSDIWRGVPKTVMLAYDLIMQALFLNVDQGAGPEVYASFAELDLMERYRRHSGVSSESITLSDNPSYARFVTHPFIPYIIPYYYLFNSLVFEAISVYTGPQWGTVSLTARANAKAVELWEYSSELCDGILNSKSVVS